MKMDHAGKHVSQRIASMQTATNMGNQQLQMPLHSHVHEQLQKSMERHLLKNEAQWSLPRWV